MWFPKEKDDPQHAAEEIQVLVRTTTSYRHQSTAQMIARRRTARSVPPSTFHKPSTVLPPYMPSAPAVGVQCARTAIPNDWRMSGAPLESHCSRPLWRIRLDLLVLPTLP